MKDNTLKHTDPEDIEDLLVQVETSFDIRFVQNELMHINTFGQLCDHIATKITRDNSDDCTSQQAFYKLRNAIASTLQTDNKTISPNSLLADLLPRQSRRLLVHQIEAHLGFKLNMLRPPHWITGTLGIIFIAALVVLFFNWQMGLVGITFSILGLWSANRTANEIDLSTVGQVAAKMTREHYVQSRRNAKSFNKNEIEKIVRDLFSNHLDVDKHKLTRAAKFR